MLLAQGKRQPPAPHTLRAVRAAWGYGNDIHLLQPLLRPLPLPLSGVWCRQAAAHPEAAGREHGLRGGAHPGRDADESEACGGAAVAEDGKAAAAKGQEGEGEGAAALNSAVRAGKRRRASGSGAGVAAGSITEADGPANPPAASKRRRVQGREGRCVEMRSMCFLLRVNLSNRSLDELVPTTDSIRAHASSKHSFLRHRKICLVNGRSFTFTATRFTGVLAMPWPRTQVRRLAENEHRWHQKAEQPRRLAPRHKDRGLGQEEVPSSTTPAPLPRARVSRAKIQP
jgi:hypothetical protein